MPDSLVDCGRSVMYVILMVAKMLFVIDSVTNKEDTEDNVDDGSARLVTSSKVALLVAGEGVQALAGSWLWCGALGEL